MVKLQGKSLLIILMLPGLCICVMQEGSHERIPPVHVTTQSEKRKKIPLQMDQCLNYLEVGTLFVVLV
jgi:hypothetical protein